MNHKTLTVLSELNRDFYSRFAQEFARTRRTWPPGFERILPDVRPAANVLDLGCGNGRFLSFLAARGWRGAYTGVDSSETLLDIARQTAHGAPGIQTRFQLTDLLGPDWVAQRVDRPADAIVCLAVLHHIPGKANRERFVSDCAALLAPGGRMIVSTWQFTNSERLLTRLLPWEAIGLRQEELEPEDYLLGWGQGMAGRRYCASIGEPDLAHLAAAAGLTLVSTFFADGLEGNLNLYGIFASPARC